MAGSGPAMTVGALFVQRYLAMTVGTMTVGALRVRR
jgi:hypothetical protein